jgi:transposase
MYCLNFTRVQNKERSASLVCVANDVISESLEFQGWKVEKFENIGGDIHIHVVRDGTVPARCSICADDDAISLKGYLPERRIRHLGFFHRKTFILLRQSRVYCGRCDKVVPELVSWVMPYHRQTVMFERLCASLCDKFAVTAVAEHMHVDKSTLYEIDSEWIDRRTSENRVSLDSLRYIGIDEVMVKRVDERKLVKIPVPLPPQASVLNRRERRKAEQKSFIKKWVWGSRPLFATMIYDLETGRLVAAGEGRSSEVASKLLKSLGKAVLDKMEAVCMDMAECYKKAVIKILPGAVIVFDRFHIKTYVNEAVDEVRKAAQSVADKDDRKFIYNQRWLLLKSEPKENEMWRLENLFDMNKDLALAYQMKDQFDEIYSSETMQIARKRLGSYISYCRRSRLHPFRKLAGRLEKWKTYLLNYFVHPITNGMVEGMNNVVKRVMHRGFGYRRMSYFFGKVRVATGDIPTMMEMGVSISENKYKVA